MDETQSSRQSRCRAVCDAADRRSNRRLDSGAGDRSRKFAVVLPAATIGAFVICGVASDARRIDGSRHSAAAIPTWSCKPLALRETPLRL